MISCMLPSCFLTFSENYIPGAFCTTYFTSLGISSNHIVYRLMFYVVNAIGDGPKAMSFCRLAAVRPSVCPLAEDYPSLWELYSPYDSLVVLGRTIRGSDGIRDSKV